jgi:hypothetical protein
VPNINDAFPSNYVKASDLKGNQCVVTIDRVEFEPVGRDKEMKAVVYFAGRTKGMVLNKTNAKKIIEISGSPQTEEWVGVQVAIYPTETEYAGDTVECIRVKAAPARRQQPAQPPPPPIDEAPMSDSDIPF